jgi:hypothetical protein
LPTTSPPLIYKNDRASEWGLGTIIKDHEGKVTLVFQHAGAKVFLKSGLTKVLSQATLPEGEARDLDNDLRGRKRATRATAKDKKKAAKSTAAQLAKATFPSFEAQLELFLKLFPGGFTDPTFVTEERGVPGATGKAGYKEAGIAFAAAQLSEERFANDPPEVLFQSAKKALQSTNIAHPIEGAIPFGGLAEADREAPIAALRTLLHGSGEYAPRFDAFVGSVHLKSKDGKPRPVTWPLATLLPALLRPDLHVAVKPTAFASQAAMLGYELKRSLPVTGAGYARFLEVALKTREKLLAAGQAPRDLMDVYSFIWRTHAEKPAEKPAA